jgi:hypothetical protein
VSISDVSDVSIRLSSVPGFLGSHSSVYIAPIVPMYSEACNISHYFVQQLWYLFPIVPASFAEVKVDCTAGSVNTRNDIVTGYGTIKDRPVV